MTELKTAPPPPPHPSTDERRSGAFGLIALVASIVLLGVLTRVSIVIVVLAIVFMVFMHELGHYVTAKRAGMKVTEFFIGFGPRIWSFRRGETEYGIKAIPAGAYVRIIGMHNLEEVPAEDEPRTYRQKSYGRRMSVAVAGSTMHFLMALVSIFVLLVAFGAPNGRIFDTRSFEEFDRETPWVIGDVLEDSGADEAGIEPGDRIRAIEGEAVVGFADVRDLVLPRPGDEVTLLVERDGETFETTATLGRNDEGDGLLGVTVDRIRETVDYGPISAIGQTFEEFGTVTVESVQALGRFFSPSGLSNFADQVAAGGDDTGDEPSGGGGGGPGDGSANGDRVVSIFGATRLGADATEQGVEGLLFFMILINVFIGIFNLVPLLPLDGGHVAIATYERIRSRRGRPYHADVAKLLPITYVVVLALIMLFVTTTYLDIVNPITLE